MIHDAKQLFVAHGADLDYIYTDAFSFQHPDAGAELAALPEHSGARESSREPVTPCR